MASQRLLFILVLLGFVFVENTTGGSSGNGRTTRYWDCCKPTCSWPTHVNLAKGSKVVLACNKDDSPLLGNDNAESVLKGGPAYGCSNQQPWKKTENLSYGFAAVRLAGQDKKAVCCACFELTFTSDPVKGKKMIVQATNTGDELTDNHFDIAIPGGGVGANDCCTPQYDKTWGENQGGVTSREQCNELPEKLKTGCYWRFDWLKNANNSDVSFKSIRCPRELTRRTGCRKA